MNAIFPFIWIRLFLWDEYPRVELLGQKLCTFLLILMDIAKLLSSRTIPIYTPMNSVQDKGFTVALPIWGIKTFKIFFFVNVIVIWYLTVILIVFFFFLKVIQWVNSFSLSCSFIVFPIVRADSSHLSVWH